MNILSLLKDRFRVALLDLIADPSEMLELIRPAQDARFGDYQANCAMPLAKQLGRSPRDIAATLVAKLQVDDICQAPEIAGPGFINLRLRDDWLAAQLTAAFHDERLGLEAAAAPRTYVVDYSSPNVAKPMHVGHIRSTVIGDALCRILRCLGHRVISDNHLGDWGTQFGMILYGYKHFVNARAYAEQPVAELGRLYKLVHKLVDYYESRQQLPVLEHKVPEREATLEQLRKQVPGAEKGAEKKHAAAVRKAESQLADARTEVRTLQAKLVAVESDPDLFVLVQAHPRIAAAVLEETAKLHAGDPENRRLWAEFLPHCRDEIQRIYRRLDIRFDQELGESFYHDQLDAVVQDFQSRGLARESDGATCVFLEGFDAPMIIRKSDGAFLYATTDLATIAYRVREWNPDAILYVVDHRQSDHFSKLFAAARQWGFQQVELRHIAFGTVMGEDGKPYKTRSGENVGLEGLLDEAVRRALAIVQDTETTRGISSELPPEQQQRVAEVVGIGALKYADLSQNRTSDYVFSYDKMLALDGNTAAYLQYSYARVQSIFARGEVDRKQLQRSPAGISFSHPAERALGLEILRFSETLAEVLVDYRPNALTSYLYDRLAKSYSGFFENCPVLKADSDAVRHSRLALCDLTARTIQCGLNLLGMDVVERM